MLVLLLVLLVVVVLTTEMSLSTTLHACNEHGWKNTWESRLPASRHPGPHVQLDGGRKMHQKCGSELRRDCRELVAARTQRRPQPRRNSTCGTSKQSILHGGPSGTTGCSTSANSTSANSTSASWPKSNWPKSKLPEVEIGRSRTDCGSLVFFFFFLFCLFFLFPPNPKPQTPKHLNT